jgi:hypothetical protein
MRGDLWYEVKLPDHHRIGLRGTKEQILWDLASVPNIGSTILQPTPREGRLVKPLYNDITSAIAALDDNNSPSKTHFSWGEASIPFDA